MASKKSKTYQSIRPLTTEILTGSILCIDPSTGSKSSKPGYAVYKAGVLVDSGEITLDINQNRSKRLYEIARTIREEFEVPDILIVEYIPPVTYKSGNQMNGIALMALQKAIGAIIGARPVEHLLEIPASSWRHYKPAEYKKTDEWDAVCLGICAVKIAEQIIQENKND